jgi:hypothetical protein
MTQRQQVGELDRRKTVAERAARCGKRRELVVGG